MQNVLMVGLASTIDNTCDCYRGGALGIDNNSDIKIDEVCCAHGGRLKYKQSLKVF